VKTTFEATEMPLERPRAARRGRGGWRKYLVVVPVLAHRVSSDVCALESAFVEHLKMLREKMGDSIDELVLACGEMSPEEYESTKAHLGELSRERDEIRYVPLFRDVQNKAVFLTRELPKAIRRLAREMPDTVVVHSSPSHNLFRPVEVSSLVMGVLLRRTTIAVTDIDERESAKMMFESGKWSRSIYLRNKLVYDPLRHVIQKAVAASCDVVLLKGDKLVEDYGKGRPQVHGFYDTAYSEKDIIGEAELARKLEHVRDPSQPLELTYFGRLIYYKGVHHMLEALAEARDANARLNLMGFGDEEPALRALAEKFGIADRVLFHAPRQYGPPLFEALSQWHVLMACPLHVDTPRNTWDGFARGMGILAYDTEYYASLLRDSRAVELVPWGDRSALGRKIRELAGDRERVARMIENSVAAAHENSQEAWLDRRVAWTFEAMDRRGR
jgi:glycosyltransferase involved in cell wall biosynthesis